MYVLATDSSSVPAPAFVRPPAPDCVPDSVTRRGPGRHRHRDRRGVRQLEAERVRRRGGARGQAGRPQRDAVASERVARPGDRDRVEGRPDGVVVRVRQARGAGREHEVVARHRGRPAPVAAAVVQLASAPRPVHVRTVAATYGPTKGPPSAVPATPAGSISSVPVSAAARARSSRPLPVSSGEPAGAALRASRPTIAPFVAAGSNARSRPAAPATSAAAAEVPETDR